MIMVKFPRRTFLHLVATALGALTVPVVTHAVAQPETGAREVPARIVPVPNTVSPQMQKIHRTADQPRLEGLDREWGYTPNH